MTILCHYRRQLLNLTGKCMDYKEILGSQLKWRLDFLTSMPKFDLICNYFLTLKQFFFASNMTILGNEELVNFIV